MKMTDDVDAHIHEKFELQIFDAFRNPTDSQRTFREVMFLQEFGKHPNVIKLYNIFRADNDRDIYLAFEFMEADLHNVIKKGSILKDVHKQYIMCQLFRAIRFLHSGNVLHRDLKPSNVLLDADCRVKLADFGLARSLSSLEDYPEGQKMPDLTEYVATRWYRSPEILLAAKRYTKGVDMWSLGCILAEMLIGRALFPGSSTINQIERIMNTITKPSRQDIASIGSHYAASVLEKMPQRPRKPLDLIITQSQTAAIDMVQRLLVFAPQKRLTVEQCLVHPYVVQFHNPSEEPTLHYEVYPPLPDHVQLGIDDYRDRLYEMIDEQKASFKRIQHDKIRPFSPKDKSRAPIAQAECSDTDYDTARSLQKSTSMDKNTSSSHDSSAGTLRERAQSAESRTSKGSNGDMRNGNGSAISNGIKQRRRSIERSRLFANIKPSKILHPHKLISRGDKDYENFEKKY
ncbi:Protein CBG21144 [Caenorhabditis briggsae]|uniref:Protein CBG21144 n=1 Tax=Caenorhabditis briggsae TaxID=6238 RepID=A8XZD9_CAEBR|nr:Protein CBG21144 [Caenorhabditis briggsae]CAP38066.2 Protein CBG21144 [Caenorhabditis briggsae]